MISHRNSVRLAKMIQHTKKLVIVGAVPGGLAAAISLAKSGAEVTIVERRSVAGRRPSTIERGGF